MQVNHSTVYPGGHAADPGYRSTVATIDRYDFAFYSDPDGSNVRHICYRPAGAKGQSFRKAPPKMAGRVHPQIVDLARIAAGR